MDPREKEIREAIHHDGRPWGNFRRFTHNQPTTVKVITVDPGQTLSLQRHRRRDELWVVLDDGLRVQIGDQIIEPHAGDELVILRETAHRLSSTGARGRVLEIAFGAFDEDDIERLEDAYGRG